MRLLLSPRISRKTLRNCWHELGKCHIDGQRREAFPKRPQRSHTIRLLRNSTILLRKIGTRTVLTESPESYDCAERGLIFSGRPPGTDLILHNSSSPKFSLDSRAGGGEGLCGQSGRCLSFPPFSGDFCEHCPSPENCAAIFVELRSSPKMGESLRSSTEPFAPVSPSQRHQPKIPINAPELRETPDQASALPSGTG